MDELDSTRLRLVFVSQRILRRAESAECLRKSVLVANALSSAGLVLPDDVTLPDQLTATGLDDDDDDDDGEHSVLDLLDPGEPTESSASLGDVFSPLISADGSVNSGVAHNYRGAHDSRRHRRLGGDIVRGDDDDEEDDDIVDEDEDGEDTGGQRGVVTSRDASASGHDRDNSGVRHEARQNSRAAADGWSSVRPHAHGGDARIVASAASTVTADASPPPASLAATGALSPGEESPLTGLTRRTQAMGMHSVHRSTSRDAADDPSNGDHSSVRRCLLMPRSPKRSWTESEESHSPERRLSRGLGAHNDDGDDDDDDDSNISSCDEGDAEDEALLVDYIMSSGSGMGAGSANSEPGLAETGAGLSSPSKRRASATIMASR
jgi:hypothetical protein